jgi:hypothetical protein
MVGAGTAAAKTRLPESCENLSCHEDLTVNYAEWRNKLFGQPPDVDPVSLERSAEFFS